jgi:MFS family permease
MCRNRYSSARLPIPSWLSPLHSFAASSLTGQAAEDLRLHRVNRLRRCDVRNRDRQHLNGFLVGMAIGGLGFGMYLAVDLALVADVLPDQDKVAKDLGVLNIASALPCSIAPAIAPAILAIGSGSYGALYTVAGVCAVIGAVAVPTREGGPMSIWLKARGLTPH